MKKILFMLLFCFSVSRIIAGDTVTVHTIPKFSLRPEIARTLLNGTVTECYDTLVKYCNSSVSLLVDFDNNTFKEEMSDYKVVDELNDFIKQVPYGYIKVLDGVNKMNQQTIVVELYWSSNTSIPPIAQLYFILNDKEEVKTILIIAN